MNFFIHTYIAFSIFQYLCSWIKETEGASLIVAQADDPNYMRSMERALRVGDPIALTKVTISYLIPLRLIPCC